MRQHPDTSVSANHAVGVDTVAMLPPALAVRAASPTDREQLTLVLERSYDGQLIIDQSGIVVQANAAMLHMLGMAAQALCGMPLALLVLPAHCALVERALEQIVRADADDMCFDSVFMHATAVSLPVALRIGLVWWRNQPAVHMVVRPSVDHTQADFGTMRQQMAYELHDGLAQIVVSVHQHLQAFAAHYQRSPHSHADLRHVLALARDAVQESRRVIAGLRATPLDTLGLVGALVWSIDAFRARGWAVSFHEALGDSCVPPAHETVLFCVTQEALTNIAKHARARHVSITLERDHAALRLVIVDDGCGFDLAQYSHRQAGYGVGLASMRERVALVGGYHTLRSAPDHGTQIIVELPLADAQKRTDW